MDVVRDTWPSMVFVCPIRVPERVAPAAEFAIRAPAIASIHAPDSTVRNPDRSVT
jgi:hypothetical protein